MSVDPKFRAASEAAESWLNTVALVADFAKAGSVDLAYQLLLPPPDDPDRPCLQASFHEHAEVLDRLRDRLAALRDGPEKWEHGRGGVPSLASQTLCIRTPGQVPTRPR